MKPGVVRFGLALVLLLGLMPAACPAPAAGERSAVSSALQDPAELSFDNIPLRDFIANMTDRLKINYVLGPALPTSPVTLHRAQPADNHGLLRAFEEVLQAHGAVSFKASEVENLYFILRPSDLEKAQSPILPGLSPHNPGAQTASDKERNSVTLRFHDAPLKDFIQTIASLLQLKCTLDPKLSAARSPVTVSARVNKNDLFSLFAKVLQLHNVAIVKDADGHYSLFLQG